MLVIQVTILPQAKEADYLGVPFKAGGRIVKKYWIAKVTTKAAQTNIIQLIRMNNHGFNIQTAIRIYKTFIQLKLESAITVMNLMQKKMKKLE